MTDQQITELTALINTNILAATENNKITPQELTTIFLNLLNQMNSSKAEITNGLIPLANIPVLSVDKLPELPENASVWFLDSDGDGVIDSINEETLTNFILTVVGSGGDILPTPVLSAGQPTDTTIPLTWPPITGANSYIVQGYNGSAWANVGFPTTNSFTRSGLTASTEYRHRVIAVGSGFVNSGASNVVITTTLVSSGGGLGTIVNSFQRETGVTDDDNGNLTKNVGEDGDVVVGADAFSLADNDTGFMVMRRVSPFDTTTYPGESSSGVISIGVGLDQTYYDIAGATIGIYELGAGKIAYKYGVSSQIQFTANGVLATNGLMRIRLATSTAICEYSNDEGTTWIVLGSPIARQTGTARCKVQISDSVNAWRVKDLRSKKD